jgi:murein DD-endopeptidase MepM/ murein hydrolase activator NlpD
MKKLLASAFFIASIMNMLSAKSISFRTDDYTGTVSYNEKAKQGEAIFARMNMRISRYAKRRNSSEVKAVLQLYKDNQKLDSAQFYFLNSKTRRQTTPDMLAGIPVSFNLEPGNDFSLKIVFLTGIQNDNAKEIILPFNIENAIFSSFEQDTGTSDIEKSTFMTPDRLTQAEKLSCILKTINPFSVYGTKPFSEPLREPEKIASCGDRIFYEKETQKQNYKILSGNEYDSKEGTEVFACAEGKVALAEFRIDTGWSVVIEHLPGLYSTYLHLSSVNVKPASSVRQGEKIGLSGSTGLSARPRLKWEVWLNNAPVQPEFFMKDFLFSSTE